MNFGKPSLPDKAVREALYAAMDKDKTSSNTVYYGVHQPDGVLPGAEVMGLQP